MNSGLDSTTVILVSVLPAVLVVLAIVIIIIVLYVHRRSRRYRPRSVIDRPSIVVLNILHALLTDLRLV